MATKYLGAHVSIQGGIHNAPLEAQSLGATAFACFTKNQRRWHEAALSPEKITAFKTALQQSQIAPGHILAHAAYLINLGHPDLVQRQVSIKALQDEAARCAQLGIELLNVHPGSHLGMVSEEVGLTNIASALNEVLKATTQVTIVLENTAGQGGTLGSNFTQLARLLEMVERQDRVGICIDTCHLFAAGYDFTTKSGYLRVWQEFERLIGWQFLKGLHLNDSKQPLGSRKDRHESLGYGLIGLAPFKLLMQDPRFDNIPLILETPDPGLWPEELRTLANFSNSR